MEVRCLPLSFYSLLASDIRGPNQQLFLPVFSPFPSAPLFFSQRTLSHPYDLEEPTLLPIASAPSPDGEDEDGANASASASAAPSPKFAHVATSCSACHTIALTTDGIAYGWGRNEANQLGLATGPCPSVGRPVPLSGPWGDVALVGAACGKSHSVLVDAGGRAYSVGSNVRGQCGINSSQDHVPRWRKCSVPAGGGDGADAGGERGDGPARIVRAACGEEFTVLLSSGGGLYTAGSAEFGQLGNGATGEHIVAAGKIGFANATKFERRSVFVQTELDAGGRTDFSSSTQGSEKIKYSTLPRSAHIAIASVSCGRNHAVAVEAPARSGAPPRVFTWGCGSYGCLGHGIQADEHRPRLVSSLRGPLFASNLPRTAAAGSTCTMVLTAQGHAYYFGKHRMVGEATMRPALIEQLANNAHVVTALSAGGATVFLTTKNAVTVSWGVGQTGELGYGRGNQKSSSQPKFVERLDSVLVTSVACGYGHTVFLVRDDDADDAKALGKMAKLSEDEWAP